MLTQISLRHFKCFEILNLPLRPLTLLSGANASGKSSILHALVLLHQTIREHEWSPSLMLNGDSAQLGSAGDLIDQVSGHRKFSIGLLDGDISSFDWEFEGERDDMGMAVRSVHVVTDDGSTLHADSSSPLHFLLPYEESRNIAIDSLVLRLRELSYLTAERLGPREIYPLEGPRLAPVVGPKGEHTVDVLFAGRDENVSSELVLEGIPPKRLNQVEAQMARFFPSCELSFEKVPKASSVTLGIRTNRSVEFHRPVHTGFGLTQVLPIVTAALTATQEGLLLVENPEVHLHPAGQGLMGEFLAEVSAAGVQVILETHSDHVLNGIRRAIKQEVLPPNHAALHFFRSRADIAESSLPQVESPTVDIEGNIDSWPDGFFDQFDKDMNQFAGWI